MTRDEVKDRMHDYMDDLLSLEERETIDHHLEEYDDIAAEYELLEKLLQKAESLPIGIIPPEDLIKDVNSELLSSSLEKYEKAKQEKLRAFTEKTELGKQKKGKDKSEDVSGGRDKSKKKFKPSRKILKGPIIIFVAMIIAVGSYFLYDVLVDNFPWQMQSNYGQFTVNGAFVNATSLNLDDNVTTFDSSSISIEIPNSGRVELGSFSTLKILQGKDSENIIRLEAGSLDVFCKIDNPALKIYTSQANLDSRSGNYSLHITNEDQLFVETGSGIVNINTNKEELLLIQDHNCRVLGNGEISIPVHIDASPEIVEIVRELDNQNNTVVNYSLLLEKATPLDGVTLFYFLKEAQNSSDRLAIFMKLNEMYPIPPNVDQQGVIGLNPQMLSDYLEEIEWQI